MTRRILDRALWMPLAELLVGTVWHGTRLVDRILAGPRRR
jgi:hypothetical protein